MQIKSLSLINKDNMDSLDSNFDICLCVLKSYKYCKKKINIIINIL